MDFMQAMETMGTGGIPVVAAFFIGLMTAFSPCTLATNITAIAYISKRIDSSRHTLLAGCVYTLGRMVAYVAVASVIVYFGMNIQFISLGLQHYGELLLGPFLIACGIYLLDIIPLGSLPGSCRVSSFSSGVTARLAEKGYLGAFLLGIIFAMSFCPFSVVLFFAMLIPLALGAGDPVILPAVFAIATGLPVIVFSLLLATSASQVGKMMKKVTDFEFWLQRAVAVVFIVVGIYYTAIIYLA